MALRMTVASFSRFSHLLVYYAMNYRCYDDTESESGSVGTIRMCDV